MADMLGPYQLNDVYCGDCAELMKQLPDGCIDLTVTSPPYDSLRKYKGYAFDFESTAKELYRVTKKGGVVVWVVGDATVNGSESLTSFKQAIYFVEEVGFNLHDTMVYAKRNAMPLNHNRYDPSFEYMFVFCKFSPKTFHPLLERTTGQGCINKRWQGKKSSLDVNSLSRQRNEETVVKAHQFRKNVWFYAVGVEAEKETGNHTAIFPELLASDHILSWSNPGDIVLDPFMGSGTTGKMAKTLRRRFLGFEIAQEYVDLAKKRIDGVTEPLPLDFG